MRVLQLQRLCPPVLAHGLTMTCDAALQATGKQEGLMARAAAMLNSLVVITMEESSSAGHRDCHVNCLNSTTTVAPYYMYRSTVVCRNPTLEL